MMKAMEACRVEPCLDIVDQMYSDTEAARSKVESLVIH